MSYPERLLPQPTYKQIDFDWVSSRSYYLVRHTDSTDITTEEGRLKSDYVVLQTDHLRDYSTNLLGEFEPDDVAWNWLKGTTCTQLWSGNCPGQMPTVGTDVEWVAGRGRFYLAIYQHHTFSFPANGGTEQITCRVLHTPTNGNFWHCSLRWWWNSEDVATYGDDRQAQKRRRQILSTAKTFITINALLTEPTYQAVPPEAYQQTVI
ncbi:hypothetical protein [Spirosoma montaniterrae]|uniref:Uncharacterized protein n=1 Tax=Spirosoma montaniterrae TaxID=1178516 RepID=A0A1P9X053_9BACT|nr:hypothetical protein [Spirosoma montaniterrae]AQG81017.1 hypothetical protein AWR27_17830 [Spirosoma montaniterrae]